MSTAGYANAIKCHDTDYVDFLIASPPSSSTEAAKEQPDSGQPPPMTPSHGSSTASSPARKRSGPKPAR